MKRLSALAVLVLPLAGCMSADSDAPAPRAASAEARSCFFLNQVNGFNRPRGKDAKRNQVVVNVGVRDAYLFETLGPCPELNWSENLGFDQRTPGQICDGIDVDLIVPGTIGPQRCPVRMIRKLSEADLKAK